MSVDRTSSTVPMFVIERSFNASRERVFQAFTEADRMGQWWGPKGMALEVRTFEPRPGGLFHYAMRSPEGHTMWGKWIFRELAAPERLVWVSSFADEAGNTTVAPFFDGVWPLETSTTVTLAEAGSKTVLRLEATPLNASLAEQHQFTENFDSMTQGFGGTWDQLDEYLAKGV